MEVTNKERGAPGVGEPHPDCVEPLLVREEPRPVEESHLVQNREDDANKEGILEETQTYVVEITVFSASNIFFPPDLSLVKTI